MLTVQIFARDLHVSACIPLIVFICCKQLQTVSIYCKQFQSVANSCKQFQSIANSFNLLQTSNSFNLLQTVSICCKQFQSVAICCKQLQTVSICCKQLHTVSIYCKEFQFVANCLKLLSATYWHCFNRLHSSDSVHQHYVVSAWFLWSDRINSCNLTCSCASRSDLRTRCTPS